MASQKSQRTVIGVSCNPAEIQKLDRQCRLLGPTQGRTRSTALKTIWSLSGDDAVEASQRLDQSTTAAELTVAPLVEALEHATAAWQARAHEREAIAALSKQVGLLTNVLRVRLREGEVEAQDVLDELERLVLAQRAMTRRLDEQTDNELDDDQVLADVRGLINQMRPGS